MRIRRKLSNLLARVVVPFIFVVVYFCILVFLKVEVGGICINSRIQYAGRALGMGAAGGDCGDKMKRFQDKFNCYLPAAGFY